MLPGIRLFDLSGRSAIITGGSRGLGEAMAAGLASAGANIVITSRDADAAAASTRRIAADYGQGAIGLAADVCNGEQVESTVEKALAEFGRIDILINNAGINIRGPIDELDEEDFRRVQQTNVEGVWRCCKSLVPHFKQQGSGRIINVASTLGPSAVPWLGNR